MCKSKIAVAILAAALAFAPMQAHAVIEKPHPAASSSAVPVGVWLIFGCASGIILAAAIASARHNRQLSQREAATCGLLFLLNTSAR